MEVRWIRKDQNSGGGGCPSLLFIPELDSYAVIGTEASDEVRQVVVAVAAKHDSGIAPGEVLSLVPANVIDGSTSQV